MARLVPAESVVARGRGSDFPAETHSCNAGSPSSGPWHPCLLALGAVEVAGVLLGEGEHRFGPRLQEELRTSSTSGPCARRCASFPGSDCPQARSFSVPPPRLRVLTGRGGGGGSVRTSLGSRGGRAHARALSRQTAKRGPRLEFPAHLTS